MTRRGFCPECGAPIVVNPDANPQFVAIRTPSLDDPGWFNPQVDVWTSDAHPWDRMNPAFQSLKSILRLEIPLTRPHLNEVAMYESHRTGILLLRGYRHETRS
jgi:glutathione-dependent formaldehyde-activating enzyme